MADIARMAEVDISTVSRALANSPKVTDDTKEKIRKLVEETGYVVNHGARMLRNQRSGQILVMLPNIAATFFPEVVLGIEDELQEHQFTVVVGSTRNDKEREDMLARQLLNGAADGMILMTGRLPDELLAQPSYDRLVVGVSRTVPNADIPQVNIDNRQAAITAVKHLFEGGHRRIAHLSGPIGSPTFQARVDGYLHAMDLAGASAQSTVINSSGFNLAAGATAMTRLLESAILPTAIICASDEMAIGAMDVAQKAGLSIPEDISFIGFDDLSFSSALHPSLSTIRIPRYEMGRIGARMLLQNLDSSRKKPENIIMGHELIERRSSRVHGL
ncbi:LacI family DNA-binding transcriptional regulator [Rhizobium sp. NPDC090275]|uniref:LacI family DNA-binding transcriptional regulator n=1 Tax=Rhizobium sp. NPDC090275 TaxID=3364498 RepID=UPI00383AA16A